MLNAPSAHPCGRSGSGKKGLLHMEVCRGKGIHLPPEKALTDKSERARGSIQRSRNLGLWRALLTGGEESLWLIGDELASGMQHTESGKCQGLVCFRF